MPAYFILRRLYSIFGSVNLGIFIFFNFWIFGRTLNADGVNLYNSSIADFLHLPFLGIWIHLLITLPLFFHFLFGLKIYYSGKSNSARYGYLNNFRYGLTRLSFVGSFFVMSLYGVCFTQFSKYSGSSGGYMAIVQLLQTPWIAWTASVSVFILLFYYLNFLWSSLISWGLLLSQAVQKRVAGGFALLFVGAVVCQNLIILNFYYHFKTPPILVGILLDWIKNG